MTHNHNSTFLKGMKRFLSGIITIAVITPVAVNALEFPSAPERNPPKSTAAGGRRGGCVLGELPIKAITPGDDNHIKTVSSQPPLFVYIPKTKAKTAQFVLKSNEGKQIDFQEISIENGDYITKINLSPDVKLQEGEEYLWEISLVCNPMFINSGNYTKGTIERVSLDDFSQNQIQMTSDTLKIAEVYANADIWSETLTTLMAIKDSQPQEWRELFNSVGLQDYADKSFKE